MDFIIFMAIFILTFIIGVFAFSQIMGSVYSITSGKGGSIITILIWLVIAVAYAYTIYYFRPQDVWALIIPGVLSFFMSNSSVKKEVDQMPYTEE